VHEVGPPHYRVPLRAALAVHFWHSDVEEDKVRPGSQSQSQGRQTIVCDENIVAGTRQRQAIHFIDDPIIVYYQHSGDGAPPRLAIKLAVARGDPDDRG